MIKVNTEILVSTLFNLGFDKIDPVLFVYTLGFISKSDELKFTFKEESPSIGYNRFVENNGTVIKLKDGYTLDTNVSPNKDRVIPLRKTLFGDKQLYEYLSNCDFSEIVSKKAKQYGVKKIKDIDTELFCEKEINILKSMQAKTKTKRLKK